MKKIVAMIPARLGSQRIPRKNLRLLGGKLLVEWVASSCIEANIFDEIYINCESELMKKVADKAGVNFYKRPEHLASSDATNDDFALDFINQIECDILVQINPTSPFTRVDDIKGAIAKFKKEDLGTLHTVKKEQIEGLFEGRPLNFDPSKQMPPSQDLSPIYLFTSSIMIWDTLSFKKNMRSLGCAVYGGNSKIGYYEISGNGRLDIDNEVDFQMAELILELQINKSEAQYYEI